MRDVGLITCGRSVVCQRARLSVGGGTGNNCLGVVHMENEFRSVQVDVGREEQGERETHRESERRNNEEQTLNRSSKMA